VEKIFKAQDINLEALQGLRLGIIGYGSQGRAQALNLRDSGLDVLVGARPQGASWQQAVGENWDPLPIETAVSEADLVCLMTPDMAQPEIYRTLIEPHLKTEATLLFAHGFNIHYRFIEPAPSHDVVLVSPKGPGLLLREFYLNQGGLPALVAVHQDASGKALDKALCYAWGIGAARAGIMLTDFAEETECDLFSEQVILCGGLVELIKAGWETLVNAGYRPEIAYFECLHEVKLIADMLYDGGLKKMHKFISDTAAYGGVTRGNRVIGPAVKQEMLNILQEIRDGRFAGEWQQENLAELTHFRELVRAELAHPIEEVGQRVRSNFLWNEEH
jgi:ketol-acid reductoisomerase